MRVLWICGLPNDVRLNGTNSVLTPNVTAAWSWVLGHLPPPQDVELHIACPVMGLTHEEMSFYYRGVHWYCFQQKRFEQAFLWIRSYWTLKKFVDKIQPDVIHGWGGETGCGWLSTLLSKKAIVSVQGLLVLFWKLLKEQGKPQSNNIRKFLLWFCECHTYRRAFIRLVESEASRMGLKDYYRQDGILVPHPLRDEFCNCNIEKRRDCYKLPIKIVFVGTLNARKGALDALDAFCRFVALERANLVMIGDGPYKEKLETLILEKGMRSKILLKSNLSASDIVQEFQDAQFFLLPSYGDTGPTALKEALACGLFPICYDNSGPHDLINHYRCGYLCRTGDITKLVVKLQEAVSHVRECVESGIRASYQVREECSRMSVWSKLMDIYKAQVEVV